ncbi:unnamed protein product [Prunus brigantina]
MTKKKKPKTGTDPLDVFDLEKSIFSTGVNKSRRLGGDFSESLPSEDQIPFIYLEIMFFLLQRGWSF